MNDYSEDWYTEFQSMANQTSEEVAFLKRQLPLSSHSILIDLCCGDGRHTLPLSEDGYDITGIDRNEIALLRAEKKSPRSNFILGDVRNYHFPEKSAHGIFCLWQSFGFYTHMENRRLLADWRRILKDKGRLVLDVYNRDFFHGKDGVRSTGTVIESKQLKGNRLLVHLQYPNGKSDSFDWELYTLPELKKIGEECGLELISACSTFTEAHPVSENEPRMQLVFQKITSLEKL